MSGVTEYGGPVGLSSIGKINVIKRVFGLGFASSVIFALHLSRISGGNAQRKLQLQRGFPITDEEN